MKKMLIGIALAAMSLSQGSAQDAKRVPVVAAAIKESDFRVWV
jgi:hypothetical protein